MEQSNDNIESIVQANLADVAFGQANQRGGSRPGFLNAIRCSSEHLMTSVYTVDRISHGSQMNSVGCGSASSAPDGARAGSMFLNDVVHMPGFRRINLLSR